jgi:hypothetical protein
MSIPLQVDPQMDEHLRPVHDQLKVRMMMMMMMMTMMMMRGGRVGGTALDTSP